jgi:crotonobetainyl-CoA:carnitine CoA-transferase CaiB-like acyl-CoA transferase
MRPLDGIRVTDFTNHAAGPYCALMLALLGAEVIRIESRARLDIQRRPHPVYGRMDIPNFDHLAGHKKSVTLNLKTETGQALAKEIVSVSDVVVENFRPGVMGRLNLAWENLKKLRSDLVMLSISAYGQNGPKSTRPGYAPIFAAEGGLGSMTGFSDGAPGEIRNQMDHQVGLTAALTIVALLEERELSGEGTYADLSATEVASMMIGESIVQALAGEEAMRIGTSHEVWSPHGVFPVIGEDNWIAISVRSDDEWERLVGLISDSEWTEGLEKADARRAHREEIDVHLARWTSSYEAVELARSLQAAGVCADISMSAADIDGDYHLNARGSITRLVDSEFGNRRVIEAPWRFRLSPAPYDTWSPRLGADNEHVICGLLGHDPLDLERWVNSKVVF